MKTAYIPATVHLLPGNNVHDFLFLDWNFFCREKNFNLENKDPWENISG